MPTLEQDTATLLAIGDNGRVTTRVDNGDSVMTFRCALDTTPHAVEYRVAIGSIDIATDTAALLAKVQADPVVIAALAAGWD